jgi:hypothetical protein
MTRAASLILSALFLVSAAGPALAQGQPPDPSQSPAVTDPGRPSHIIQPRAPAARHMPPKQTKKMGHAGKKMSKHHGKPGHVGRKGAAPERNVPSEGQAAQPQQ